MWPWSTSDLIHIRAFVSNCGYSILLMCLICYPGTTVLMIDRIFAWIVTRKFGMIFSLFSLSRNRSWLSLDLSLSSPFQGLLKICSERALKRRKGKQMLIKSDRQMYGSKDVLLSFPMCSLSKCRRNLSLEICVIIFIWLFGEMLPEL